MRGLKALRENLGFGKEAWGKTAGWGFSDRDAKVGTPFFYAGHNKSR